ncbi:MAG: hypothetical protein JJT90_10800 [Ectothiorhodospiraceae bacterium]|nr:hypothetical protein [Ectothiorhodospiraceae bacterium]
MRDDHYRNLLIETEQKAQEGYDKAILSLSGGALGISFAFVGDLVPLAEAKFVALLLGAWVSWTLAIAFTLFSYLSSVFAMREAIENLDEGKEEASRGFLDRATDLMNVLAGILFVLGVGSTFVFIFLNVMQI